MASLAPAEKAPTGKPLKVGSPHDPAEREAGRVADILTAPEEPAMPVCAACAAGGAPCAACGGGGGGVLRRQALQGYGGIPGPRSDDIHAIAAYGVAGRGSTLPGRPAIQAAFGKHEVSGVRAHVGGAAADAAAAIGARAYATGNDIAFADTPDLRIAAHEAAHVVQQRRGVSLDRGLSRSGDAYEQNAEAVAELVVRGESAEALLDTMTHREPAPATRAILMRDTSGASSSSPTERSGGVTARDVAPEVEAHTLAPRVASGEPVDVREALAGRVHRDDAVAQQIHEKLHGWVMDDEAGALQNLQGDHDIPGTIHAYQRLFGYPIWGDFQDNASGDILQRALALLWPHMTLNQRLETQVGIDDDEAGIMQTIRNASDAEVRAARPDIQPYLDELDAPDQYQMRRLVWPEQAVDNVAWLLSAGRGWWDDEGPVATALLDLTPMQRVQLWRERQPLVVAMFSVADAQQIRRMCITDSGEMATETDALRVRMELATDGLGTDEEGVTAAVATAGTRRDERARLAHAVETGTNPDGTSPTEDEIHEAEARIAAIGDVEGELLTAREGAHSGTLAEDSFLGRVQGDMDAATLDAALATAHTDAYERAKQALLGTEDWTGNVDEEAVIRLLDGIQGEMRLEAGETVESIGAAEARRRRTDSATRIRLDLRDDPELNHIFGALGDWAWDGAELDMLNAVTAGNEYEQARLQIVEAYEGIDTDESAILTILRDTTPEVRERLRGDPTPAVVLDIRRWAGADTPFRRAFDETLRTGHIPMEDALDEALGGSFDGTNVELVNEVLGSLSDEDRRAIRRGYLLSHALLDGDRSREMSDDDRAAVARYQLLRMRLRDELSDEDLDTAIAAMVGLPTVNEMRSEDSAGRIDAAAIMLYRQRERLEMGANLTDAFTTTDDTAESAHVEFEARYNQALEDGDLTTEEFAVLVNLDTQFNDRFREYSATANMVAEIAGTVAAVAAAAVVIAATGGTAAPGVIPWLTANSTLIGQAAAYSALSQVAVAEVAGGSFHEAIGADGAREALSGAINGALAVCGAALAEHATALVGLSGPSLTATIARAAAESVEVSVAGRAFARGALVGLIDGSLGGAIGELSMTLTDAQTWRQSVWGVLGRAGAALLRGGLLGGLTGAGMGGLMEMAHGLLQARAMSDVICEMNLDGSRIRINYDVTTEGAVENLVLRFGPETSDADIAAHVDRIVAIRRASSFLQRARAALTGLEDAPVGTISGDAAHEAAKVPDMIADRLRQLSGELTDAERDVIESEIAVLRSNFDHFSAVAAEGNLDAGTGEIARLDKPTPSYPACPPGYYYREGPDGWDLRLLPGREDQGLESLTLVEIPEDEIVGVERYRVRRRSEVTGAPEVRAAASDGVEHAVDSGTRAELDALAATRLEEGAARDAARTEMNRIRDELGLTAADVDSDHIEATVARLRNEHAGDGETLAQVEELARQRGLFSAASRDMNYASEEMGNRAAMYVMEDSGYRYLFGNPTPPGRSREFDFIYVRRNSNGDIVEICVVEAKGAGSTLGSARYGVRVEQGTPQYLEGTARVMMTSDETELNTVLKRIINRSGPGPEVSYVRVQAPVDAAGNSLEPIISRFRIDP